MAGQRRGFIGTVKAVISWVRDRSRLVDHAIAMLSHYGKVSGNVLAGGVTYFGFLSFFPLIAIAFSVVGYVAKAYPNAEQNLVTAIQQVFPGIVTVDGAHGTISMNQIKDAKTTAGLIGFLFLLYAGLGWVSGLRQSLQTAFELPQFRRPNFFVGKARDFVVMLILGFILIVSVTVSTFLQTATGRVLSTVDLDDKAIGPPLVVCVGIVIALSSSTLLFFVMYRLLGRPHLPLRALLSGALLGASGFEVLKLLVVYVLGRVGGTAFAPLAIAITLMVWINYFSRLVIYGASWAVTSRRSAEDLVRPSAASQAAVAATDLALGPGAVMVPVGEVDDRTSARKPRRWDVGSAVAGAVAGAIGTVLFRRRRRGSGTVRR